ncbi:hypothetical protein [Nitrosovibrio tenuis]|uniref:Uncharacterized protein n=1 Tax=Nitrosovibrio tenuis TaxID=1233 RepID=A0A1H7NM05_9PROT|nr:hypothetical protein [Nitrosovibrio tenuis]SEL24532.1 hypothetical protein SAMN05216387_10768 [Nitrosovibrio tenuis]
MKTVHSLFLTLLVAASFSSPVALAGEPNTDAFTSQPGSDKSKATLGRDCPPEMSQEVNSPDAAILLE